MNKVCYLGVMLCMGLLKAAWGFDFGANMYTVTVPVQDTTPVTRQQAIQRGWQQLLVKVSGNRSINTLPLVKAEADQAQLLLESFNYSEGSAAMTPALVLHFSPAMVKRFLKRVHQPFWGQQRPTVLLWLVDMQTGHILSTDDPQSAVIKQQARLRGLPIILPMMNLSERASISAANFTPIDRSWLAQHSERYQPDCILVGRIPSGAQARPIQWTELSSRGVLHWQASAAALQQQLMQVVNHLADVIATRDAVVATGAPDEAVQLSIVGVDSLQDYSAVLAALNKTPLVHYCQAKQLSDGHLLLMVQAAGGGQALATILAKDARFLLQVASGETADATLTYQWMRPSAMVQSR